MYVRLSDFVRRPHLAFKFASDVEEERFRADFFKYFAETQSLLAFAGMCRNQQVENWGRLGAETNKEKGRINSRLSSKQNTPYNTTLAEAA